MIPAKRALDLVGALVGLVLFAPVLAAVALAVFVSLGRPVLFRQERSGHHGRPFRLLKFRTMRHPLPGEEGPEHDHLRVTRLGRFLRATSLDELPELWNVLRGEMSLVGPRPLPLRYVSRYTRRQARRLEVPPGLTGWAQVNGRKTVGWDDRFELDVWYVDHASLALDLRILWRTVVQVLRRNGIDHAEGVTMHEFRGPAVIDLADAAAAGGSAGLPFPPSPFAPPLPPPMVGHPSPAIGSGSPVAPVAGANDAAGRRGAGAGGRRGGRPVEVLVVSDLDRAPGADHRCAAGPGVAGPGHRRRGRLGRVAGRGGRAGRPGSGAGRHSAAGGPAGAPGPAAARRAAGHRPPDRDHGPGRAAGRGRPRRRGCCPGVHVGAVGRQRPGGGHDAPRAGRGRQRGDRAGGGAGGLRRLGRAARRRAGAPGRLPHRSGLGRRPGTPGGGRPHRPAGPGAHPHGPAARADGWQVTDYLPTFERAPAPRVLDLRDRIRVA